MLNDLVVKLRKKSFVFYSDFGHGWLEVKLEDVTELSLQDKISGFSYTSGDWFYLEEDSDAQLFIKAYEQKYGKIDIQEQYEDGDSFIKGLNHYRR